MGRNLYILAGTLFFLALASYGISWTNIAQQPGSPGDVSLWRTMASGLSRHFHDRCPCRHLVLPVRTGRTAC